MPVRHPRVTALVLTPPGVGRVLRDEARRRGLVTGRVENDGRSDVVPVRGDPAAVAALRCRDDVLLDLGVIPVARSAKATAAAIDVAAVARARGVLSGIAREQPVRSQVVVRKTTERSFLRTALRAAVERRFRHDRGLPAIGEIWMLQTSQRQLRVGVRVESWARRSGRSAEREGSLLPSVAAAMTELAGISPRRLLDLCCGSGTILTEATEAGWDVFGGDIDRAAITAARINAGAPLAVFDARRLPFPTGAFDVVVSNLPFGLQHAVQGTPVAWYRRVLTEALRVAPEAVVLAPPTTPFRQALGRLNASLDGRWDVSIRGQRASIWRVTRRGAPRRVA